VAGPWTPERRREAAERGHALPPLHGEGEPRFPIDDCTDVAHAVEDYGRIPDEEKPEVRRYITRRAVELDCPLPRDWHVRKVNDDD
jgi:hypothetical protein